MTSGLFRLFSFCRRFHSKIRKCDPESLCEKRHFSHTLFERAVIKNRRLLEHDRIRHKRDLCSCIRNITGACFFKGHDRLASRKSLVINDPALFDLNIEPLGKRVYYGSADAVKTAGHFVTAAAELAARMQLGKDKIYGISSCLVIDSYRDSSPVVLDSTASVIIDRHFNVRAVTCKRFIDRVIHDFIHKMVKTSCRSCSDVHARSLADSLESLEDLNIICCIRTDISSVFQIVVKFISVH